MRLTPQSGALLTPLLWLALAPVHAADAALEEVRYWTNGGITRVAVQLTEKTDVRRDRLHKPERHFFDFVGAAPSKRGMQTIRVNAPLLRQIRVAEAKPGITRVVLDLASEKAEVETSELSNPYRLIIEVKPTGTSSPLPALASTPASAPAGKPLEIRSARPGVRTAPLPPARLPLAAAILPMPPLVQSYTAALRARRLPTAPAVQFPSYRRPARSSTPTKLAKATPPKVETPRPEPLELDEPPATSRGSHSPSSRNSITGANSMTRALGLKIRRVVLDPGHGGHDQGTAGPGGLLEKDLVLDVAKRLGELIEANLGSEVVYTRSDDRFIPLEERTRIANASRADLFLSIHANSAPSRKVSGVETYYLSFTTSQEALDVAARENATSSRSVFELRDLLQKIALQDKIDESRDFAGKVNSQLYRVWGGTNARNRGVKKAPFVVLIGASMPSILTEIGFLSNPRDEKDLKRAETRQRIAEALYKGIAQYADSLSHISVAKND